MASTRASNFFSAEERARIGALVREMEERTSGEIVPMVVDQSYDYPRAEILGAGFFSLTAASLLTWGFGRDSMWVLIPLFFLFYFPYKILIRNIPALKRCLMSPLVLTEAF